MRMNRMNQVCKNPRAWPIHLALAKLPVVGSCKGLQLHRHKQSMLPEVSGRKLLDLTASISMTPLSHAKKNHMSINSK